MQNPFDGLHIFSDSIYYFDQQDFQHVSMLNSTMLVSGMEYTATPGVYQYP